MQLLTAENAGFLVTFTIWSTNNFAVVQLHSHLGSQDKKGSIDFAGQCGIHRDSDREI